MRLCTVVRNLYAGFGLATARVEAFRDWRDAKGYTQSAKL